MKPVNQDKFGKDTGNCFQAMLASILELPLEAVPDFMAGLTSGDRDGCWVPPLNKWLQQFGLFYIETNVGEDFQIPPDVFHEITGKSPRFDCFHAVVGQGGVPIHDPHPANEFVKKPYNTYGFFIARDPSKLVKQRSLNEGHQG